MAFNRLISLRSTLLGAAIIPLAATTAQAQNSQDDFEDEIIVTGLRSVAIADVTSSVTILDTEALNIRNSPYVADQLRAVPGVGVSRSGAVGALTQIRIRGAEANQTLVLVNGIEVSNANSGETNFGIWAGLNPKRIEIARGEQSALYGSDAIGGVISVETDDTPGFQARGEVGSFNTLGGNVGGTIQTGKLNLGLSFAGFQTDGVDTSGQDGERDGSNNLSGVLTAGYEFSSNWNSEFLFTYRASDVDGDPDTNFDGILENADQETQVNQFILGGTVTGQTGSISHIFKTNFSDIQTTALTDAAQTSQSDADRLKLSYSPAWGYEDNTYAVSLAAIFEYEDSNFEQAATNVDQSFETLGAGAEARGRFQNFSLNGSLRYDENDNLFEDAFTWRAGIAYNTDFGGKLRGSIGTGIKNPNFVELFGFGGTFFGNPDLDPERSQSWEVGYDQSFENGLSASVTYFNAELEDEIIFNNFFNGVINADGESDRSGVEIGVNWDINAAYSFAGSASFIESEGPDGDDEIRVPNTTASAAFSWQSPTLDGFRAAIALDYVGGQLDTDFGSFDPVTFQSPDVALDAYALLSLTAEYPMNEHFTLTFRGENLLDEDVQDVLGFNNTGAGVFFGFKLR